MPARAERFHEVKYDGYRLGVERDGDHVRPITRGGYNWTKRDPWIVEPALTNRERQFVIDGEEAARGSAACRLGRSVNAHIGPSDRPADTSDRDVRVRSRD